MAGAADALGVGVERARRVAGGDVNDAFRLELADGRAAFLKCRAGAPAGEHELEAAGLAWLGDVAGGLPVPAVLATVAAGGVGGLVLEWVDEGRLDRAGEERLGAGLARIHAAGAPGFGALPPRAPPGAPLRFGAVELPTAAAAAGAPWSRVYGERVGRLARIARDAGRHAGSAGAANDRVVERVDEIAGPPEPPARVHGDLWSGNVLAATDGSPWLIDPAAHGAHREIDLAMLRLFGTVSGRTLAAYEDVLPLAPGHEERVALWQLQPLLVHAVLFGGSYGAAAGRAAALYA
ncbi:MAG: fructosamine kinase family protein [Thermoleophilia bacterium]|nr:fructosamine kinase family protein [Thermoleophilia bacterium]